MATYVILSRFAPDAFAEADQFKKLAKEVSDKIKKECPGVEWKYSVVTLGRYDVVDIVESDDIDQVRRAAMLIRSRGHSNTETLVGTEWHAFLDNL